MIVTTTSSVEGRQITEYLGIVSGEVIIAGNVFRDVLAGVRDFFGGRAKAYEQVMTRGQQEALAEMTDRARGLGATAIVGIQFDFTSIGTGLLVISVAGTAVVLK